MANPTRITLLAAALAVAAAASASPAQAAAGIRSHRLTIVGNAHGNRIALRVKPATPGILDVDLGDDGHAERRFLLSRLSKVTVLGSRGDDRLRVDRDAPLPASLPVTLAGGPGND